MEWLKRLLRKKPHVHKFEFKYQAGITYQVTFYECKCGQKAARFFGESEYTLYNDKFEILK